MTQFCGPVSGFSIMAFVLLFPALVIHCAGYGTLFWMKTELVDNSEHVIVGLWKMSNCSGSYGTPCYDSALQDNYKTTLLTLTQAFESATLIFILMTLITSGFYVTSPAVQIQEMAVAVMILAFLSMLLSVGGMVCWIVNLPDNHFVYYSFGLTVMAAAICMVVAVLMIRDVRQFDYDGIKTKKTKKRDKKKLKRIKRTDEDNDKLTEYASTNKF